MVLVTRRPHASLQVESLPELRNEFKASLVHLVKACFEYRLVVGGKEEKKEEEAVDVLSAFSPLTRA